MMFFLLKTLVLFLIWLMLSGRFDPVHLGLGVASSLVVVWLNSGQVSSPLQGIPWARLMGYWPWLFLRILQSSLHLTRLILHPSLPIAPKLIQYRTKLRGDFPIVLLCNSITLTPGTITVEVNGQDLIVHAMDEVSSQDLVKDQFERKLARVFAQGDSRQ